MYGNGVYGVLEANYAFAICHFLSAALGASWWHKPLSVLIPVLPKSIGAVTVVMAFFYTAMLFIGLQMATQAYTVFAGTHSMDSRERGHKELGTGNALKQLLYIALFFALAYLYLNQQHELAKFEGRWMLEAVSICYSQLATQVILAHMAKDVYVPAVSPYLALLLGIVNGHVGLLERAVAAKAILAAVLAGYLHFVICVCLQVAQHLKINILTIKAD